jgi:flagellar motor protein MotB
MSEYELFISGSDEIHPERLRCLSEVHSMVQDVRPLIRIETSTRTEPEDRGRYASKWELAVAQSAAVAVHITAGDQELLKNISISGYGDGGEFVGGKKRSEKQQEGSVEIMVTFKES